MESPLPAPDSPDSPHLWRKSLRRTYDGPLSARDDDERKLLLESGAVSSSDSRAAAARSADRPRQRPSRKFAQLSQRTPTSMQSPGIVGPIGTFGWQPSLPDASRLPPPSPDHGWKPASLFGVTASPIVLPTDWVARGSGDASPLRTPAATPPRGLAPSLTRAYSFLDVEAMAFGSRPTPQPLQPPSPYPAVGSASASSLDPSSPSYFSCSLLSFAGDARKRSSFKASVAKTVIAVELARSWTDLIVLVRPLVFGLPLSVGHQPRQAIA